MAEHVRQEAAAGDTSRAVLDFMELLEEMRHVFGELESSIPQELIELRDRVVMMEAKDRPASIANPFLFFRTATMLARNSSLTMGELSDALAVPFSTATRIANWFVDNGYAERLSDPDDRRIVRLALTDSGRSLRVAADRVVLGHIQRILSALTPEEQAILLTLCRKVVTSLKQAGA